MVNSKIKKTILVLGFLSFIFIMALLIWNVFFKQIITPETETEVPTTGPADGLPTSPDGSPIIVDPEGDQGQITDPSPSVPSTPDQTVEDPIGTPTSPVAIGGVTNIKTAIGSPSLNPTSSGDGGIQFYNQEDNKFYKLDNSGNLRVLSDKEFFNVRDVEWSPNKEKAVIEFPDNSKIIYDFNNNKQVTLPKHWEDFSFSPNSDKLTAKSIGLNPEDNWLMTLNSDGSGARAIEPIGNNHESITPSWSPNNQIVATYHTGHDSNRSEVFFIGEHGQNFKSTLVEGYGFQSQWSNEGDRLLYSVYNQRSDYKPVLWIVNAEGDTIGQDRKALAIETWAEKCTFASNNVDIYCAVPKNLESGSGIFPEAALSTSDDLYKINTLTGRKSLIAVPDNAVNISNIIINDNQSSLFFTDHNSDSIYSVDLQ